jgi:DNA-binding transcriptional MocR family regulator
MSKGCLGDRADALRRDLGPTAWCTLECLVERAGAGSVAVASVRSLAAQLGVAKNTANRAIAALVRAGLIEAIQDRGTDGQFRPGAYRIVIDDISERPATKATRKRTTARTAADPAQLSLLPS